MKKFALKTAVLAIGALAAAGAMAAKDLDATVTANKYASELKIGSGIDLLDGVVTDLNFTAKHGISAGNNVVTYIRVDLGNGAKFKTNAPVLANDTAAGETVALSSGGADASFAIFSLTPNAGTSTAATDVISVTVNAAGITVVNKDAVTARIRVYETLTAAANPDSSSALKDSGAKTLISFAPGLSATITKGALTADVNPATGNAYTKFTPAVTAGSVIGKVVFAADATVAQASGDAVTLDAMIDEAAGTAASDITVTGDFSFLKGASEAYGDAAVKARVFLDAGSDCATGATTVGSKTVTATSVELANIDAANLGTHHLCVKPEGTVAIPAGAYTVAVNYEPEAAYEVTDLAATAFGDIARNGTTLVAPLVNQPTGWYSRLVLTNSGSTDRTYAVTAVKEDGSTVTLTGDAASGTVLANRTKVIDLHTLATIVAASGGGVRTGLQVVVNGPASQISGQYQIVSPAGNIANNTLVVK